MTTKGMVVYDIRRRGRTINLLTPKELVAKWEGVPIHCDGRVVGRIENARLVGKKILGDCVWVEGFDPNEPVHEPYR